MMSMKERKQKEKIMKDMQKEIKDMSATIQSFKVSWIDKSNI